MSLQPTEAELLREVITSRLTDVYTSLPARVVKYDKATQTADCEIVILRAETAESGATVHETYPVIPNVPVGWQSGGGYSLQFPLAKGDGVWLVFSMAAIANWRVTGEVSPPGDRDLHDLSYPIALPCARHDKQPLPEGTDALLTVPSGGSFSVSTAGGTPSAVAMADKVATELTRVKNDIAALKSAISDGLTGVGAGSAASGAAGAEAFDLAVTEAGIPSNPGSTASATLRAE